MECRGGKEKWGDVPGKARLEPGCEMPLNPNLSLDLILWAHICHSFIKCAK